MESVLIFGSLLIFNILLLMMILSMAWSPFAALGCVLAARSKHLSLGYYAIIGGLYSVLFIIPWVFFILNLRERYPSKKVIITVFYFLYGIWLCGPITWYFILTFIINTDGISIFQNVVEIGFLTFMIFMWVMTLKNVVNNMHYIIEKPQEAMSLNIAFILPFACMMVSNIYVCTIFYFL